MIPVDIDNFLLFAIANAQGEKYLYIEYPVSYLPKEIGNCRTLTKIFINEDEIADISVLSNCVNLTYLDLAYNKIKDISALSNCINLISLDISYNKIIDASSLSNCILLKTVYAWSMKIIKKPVLNSKVSVFY